MTVLLLSIFLRFQHLDSIPGVNGDEALVAVQVADLMAGRPVVLKMPTGRLLSPIYGVLLMIIETIFPLDFYTLRSPAFFSGCLLIILSFFLLKSLFGFRVGLFSFLLVATHPVLIAYSRLGIEQCIIPLTTLICLYFAFKGKTTGTVLSFLAAVMVHPVNIFLIPVLVIPFMVNIFSDSRRNRQEKQRLVLGTALIFVTGIILECFFLPEKYRDIIGGGALLDKVLHWRHFGHFVEQISLLMTGLTAYLQFSGGAPEDFQTFWQSTFGILCFVIFCLGGGLLIRQKSWHKLSVVIGTLVSILGFYLITGAEAIHPGVSRYTIWMIVPFLVSFAILLDTIAAKQSAIGAATWVLIGYSLINLGSFHFFYLEQIQSENTHTHQSYRTGSLEPKQAAWEWIQADAIRRGIAKPTIMAEDWWTYWPLRYLGLNRQDIKILRRDEYASDISSLKKGSLNQTYFVGFPEGIQQLLLERTFGEKAIFIHSIEGYGEQDVLNVIRIETRG